MQSLPAVDIAQVAECGDVGCGMFFALKAPNTRNYPQNSGLDESAAAAAPVTIGAGFGRRALRRPPFIRFHQPGR